MPNVIADRSIANDPSSAGLRRTKRSPATTVANDSGSPMGGQAGGGQTGGGQTGGGEKTEGRKQQNQGTCFHGRGAGVFSGA